MSETILQLNNITKKYEAVEGVESPPVLDHISIDVKQGETLSVIGPSGSGKSTLLNIIGTLDRPTSGNVKLTGRDLTEADDQTLANIRNNEIGFIFQLHHLLPQCTVLENVLIPTLVDKNKQNRSEIEERAEHLLERVGLQQRFHHRPGLLSGGERQRVAVVRALINRPILLLADEPTGSLDRSHADNLTRLLLELNQEENVTLIVVTHSHELASQMERVYELKDGKMVETGGMN